VGRILAALLLLLGGYAVWPRRRGMRRRREAATSDTRVDSLAAVLESVALCLQAGLTPVQAVDVAVQQRRDSAAEQDDAIGSVLAEVQRALHRGAPGGPAWARHSDQIPELRVVAGAWTLTEASGSSLHPAVMWSVAQLREKRAAKERLSAVTAGTTSSMMLMLALPLAGVPIGLLVGVPPGELYGSFPAGVALVVGLSLAASGAVMSKRLLRKALQPKKISAEEGLPDATLDDVADAALMLQLALSSGAGIVESIEQVAVVSPHRIRTELRRVVAGYRWGLGHRTAWSYADVSWEPVSAALALSLEHGAAPAASVKAAGQRLAESEKSRLQAAAGRAETFLLIPLVVFFLPAFALTTVIPLVIALVPRGGLF